MAILHSARSVGYLYALAAPLCWSVGGVIFRSIDTDAWDAVFWRSLAHVIVFPLAATPWLAGAVADTRRAGPAAFVAALCIAGVLILHVLAMMRTAVANVLVLQSMSPLLVAVLGRIVLGERVGPRGWITIAIAFAGLAPVIGSSFAAGRVSGDVLALGVAACSATMVILVRRGQPLNLVPVTWLGALIAVLVALPSVHLVDTSLRDVSLLLGLGVIQNTLGLGFYLLALRQLPAAQVALLALLEPVLGPLWVWLFVGEEPSPLTVAGGGVVIAALAVNTMLGLRTQRRPAALAA